jgi:hypothetical protein
LIPEKLPMLFMMRSHLYSRLFPIALILLCLLTENASAQIGAGGQGGGGGFGGFGGPSVFGGGNAAGLQRAGADVSMRFFAGVNGIYDSGLTGFRLDSNGNFPGFAAKGVELLGGVYGSKNFRRALLSLSYQGSYRQYTIENGFNGLDQSLALGYRKQLNARSTFNMDVNAGTTNRLFGLQGLNGSINQLNALALNPVNELFDNRIYFGAGSLGYSYQRTARSSITLFGSGNLVRRTGNVLFGLNGASAGAAYNFRLDRRQTLSIGYNYFFFNYTRNFGDANGHGAQLTYSTSFGRRITVQAQGGVNRMELLTLRNVAVDPVIAALIGIFNTSEVSYSILYLPTGNANITARLSKSNTLAFSGGLFVIPGNGVIGTSRNTNVGGSYTYSGLRRVNVGGGVFYNRTSTLNGPIANFTSVQTSFNASSRLRSDLFLTFTAGTRNFLNAPTLNSNFNRNAVFLNVGLAWSPGEIPLAIR